MWIILTIILLTILYYLITKNNTYWKKLGIPGPKPIPFIGNIGKNLIGTENIAEVYANIYREYEGYPFVGIYRASEPCILLRDPELIKDIVVKDFKHFMDNDMYTDKDVDPLFGRNPFVLKGAEWKKSRSQLTPSFTAVKMKAAFPQANTVGSKMVDYLRGLEDPNCQNLKEICTNFTCDNVALWAFGIEAKSFEKKKTEFREAAEMFLKPNSYQGFLFAYALVLPIIFQWFPIRLIPIRVEEMLRHLINSTLKYREERNIKRNDFLDSMRHIKKVNDSFTDIDIIAHGAELIVDGVHTSSVALSFAVLELAMNPRCQKKLREEINDVLAKFNGELSYEAIQEMPYLDACINESLRMHLPLPVLAKLCTQPYVLSGKGSDSIHRSVKIDTGMTVIIPALGIHMDPTYFPEPEKFYPERFLEENLFGRYIFLPFGEGPRECLGTRFGLLQARMLVIHLIKNFEITVNKKTKLPLKYLPYYILLYPKGGMWVDFKKI